MLHYKLWNYKLCTWCLCFFHKSVVPLNSPPWIFKFCCNFTELFTKIIRKSKLFSWITPWNCTQIRKCSRMWIRGRITTELWKNRVRKSHATVPLSHNLNRAFLLGLRLRQRLRLPGFLSTGESFFCVSEPSSPCCWL